MTPFGRRAFLRFCAPLLAPSLVGNLSGRSRAKTHDQFIVDRTSISESLARSAEFEIVRANEPLNLLIVRGPESRLAEVTDSYTHDVPVEPVYDSSFDHSVGSFDRSSTLQDQAGSINPYQWNKKIQQIDRVHDITRGSNTRVAVIDSGIQADHPDFESWTVNLDLSKNFTADGLGVGRGFGGPHGTAIAGLIAGDSYFMRGSAPGTELVDCRVFSLQGRTEGTPQTRASQFVEAIVYAAEKECDVANVSIAPGVTMPVRAQVLNVLRSTGALSLAAEKEMLVVTSAGNSSLDLEQYPLYNFPDRPNVMTISATGPLGYGWPVEDTNQNGFIQLDELEDPIRLQAPYHEFAPYSNYGRGIIDISAPGGNVVSASQGTRFDYTFLDKIFISWIDVQYTGDGGFTIENSGNWWGMGTSYAAAEVSGAAALLKSVVPDASASHLKERLRTTAQRVGRETPDPLHGAGFLNTSRLIREAARTG